MMTCPEHGEAYKAGCEACRRVVVLGQQLYGKIPLPCLHLGNQLTGQEREARGLDHAKAWAFCEHPDKPLGPEVCPCKGCGVMCPAYEPEQY